jgi:hypothetical protein
MLCNPEDAAVVIQENMTFDTNSPNFAAVKSAFENNDENMDLDCTTVAGLIDDDGEHLLKAIYDDDKPENNVKPILMGFVSGLAGSIVFPPAVVTLFKSGHNIFAVFFSLLFKRTTFLLLIAI